jgi:hypothetical protein
MPYHPAHFPSSLPELGAQACFHFIYFSGKTISDSRGDFCGFCPLVDMLGYVYECYRFENHI